MAGPVASILLPAPLTADDELRILAELTALATYISSHDFWLGDDHPFFVAFTEDYPGELDELAQEGLPTLLGWRPRGILTFCAMCNRDRDHVLLAELCIRFSESLGGIIDFGGSLRIEATSLTTTEPRRIDAPDGLPGTLYATTYTAANGELATCHFADATFLRLFLHHPSFRMVK